MVPQPRQKSTSKLPTTFCNCFAGEQLLAQRSLEEILAIVCSGPKSLALVYSRPEMAPFPDSSLSKVFLSLYLMNLSHPFSPFWSQGQMLLQHFIPPLSPVSLVLPAANLGSHSKSCPTRKKFPASGPHPSWLSFPFLFASVENFPQERECGAFLQFLSLYWGAEASLRLSSAFRANPLSGKGGKCPK